MQTPKGRSESSEVAKKVSPRVVRKLKTTGLQPDSSSSSSVPKDRSPKVVERRSPRSPISEKKRPSKISELEAQILQLQEDLKRSKDQLIASESWKKQAAEETEDLKKQILEMSSNVDIQEITQEQEPEFVALENHNSTHSYAMTEIKQLKVQIGKLAEFEAAQAKQAESTQVELESLKDNLIKTYCLTEEMKHKELETEAREIANETLMQLETAKKTVADLRSDSGKAVEAYNSVNSELEKSRARVGLLERLVEEIGNENLSDKGLHDTELDFLRSEVNRLTSSLESQSCVDQVNSVGSQREEKLEAELKNTKSEIEELKANLMDKETELQGITEENENLQIKINGNNQNNLQEVVSEMKRNLMDKETELQNIIEENETLKLDVNKKEADKNKTKESEQEALLKLGLAMEEADKSSKRAARVSEQLDAAQTMNCEMEAELRMLKVQSDQWRKAAETAAAMINNTTFVDNAYNPTSRRISSPYSEDMEDDLLKKKNGNVLKKIGVLWKKPQK